MTIPVQVPFTASTANGLTTVFPYSFKITAAEDLAVFADGVAVTTGFTVSGVGSALGGDVTFTVAPVNGTKILRALSPILKRVTDYQQFGDWIAEVVNLDFDRIWLALQTLQQNDIRALKLPFDTTTDQVLTQDAAGRANRSIKFDALGNLTVTTYDPDTAQADSAASASAAASSATAASGSATAASASASAASTSATAASGSASAAASSASSAATSAANAAGAVSGAIGVTIQAAMTEASQAEMEAGTQAALRSMSPLRVAQAIAALGSSSTDQTARDQIALTNLRLILNSAVASSAMVGGKQWELSTDEWGATSTNETYNAGSLAYYGNAGSQALISSGTAQGAFTSAGGLAAAFDGNTSQNDASSAITTTAPTGYVDAGAIGKDWGSGVTKTVTRLKMYSPTDAGFIGSNAAVDYKLQGSTNNSSWTDLYSGTTPAGTGATVDVTSGITTTTAYRYHRVVFNGNGVSALRVAEVQFYETSATANMTLIPDAAVSVSTAPPAIDVYCLWKDDSGSAVLGTDLTVELSRDNGTTYTTATLTNMASFDGTYSIIKAHASVSAQPSGTSMLCRIKTLNNKAQRVAAPALYAE